MNIESNLVLKKLKFYEKYNLLVMNLFIFLGIFFIINSQILRVPHQIPSDKKDDMSKEEEEVKDAYKYDHEYGGDRKLRIITVFILLIMGPICFILSGLLYFGTNETLKFKKKEGDKFGGWMISTLVFGTLLLGGIIYYLIFKSGTLNSGENKKYQENIVASDMCKQNGESIIYTPCSRDDLVELYNNCIAPTKERINALCVSNISKYYIVKQADNNRQDLEQALSNNNLSKNIYESYKKIDTIPDKPLTCDRVVMYKLANKPTPNNSYMNRCNKKAMIDFMKTDKHKVCYEKAKKQSKFITQDPFDKDTQEGTTFSNCNEYEKYMKEKKDRLDVEITAEMDRMVPTNCDDNASVDITNAIGESIGPSCINNGVGAEFTEEPDATVTQETISVNNSRSISDNCINDVCE